MQFTEWGIFSRILFVFVGALVTVVVQSSSAAMAITLTLCAQGWLPFEVAAAMILGENIGTTITAELASLVGNTAAKRSARIHSLFNVIGVTWMVFALPYFLPALSTVVQSIFGIADPFTNAADMPIGLSAFHTAFNLINVMVMLLFVPWLVKVAIKTVPEKEDEDGDTGLKYISSAAITPELATIELQKEATHYGEIVSRMSRFIETLLNSTVDKEQRKSIKKIKKYEKISDKMEIEITEYITKLADKEITPKTSIRLRSFLNIANDLERIGDIYFQMSKTLERKMDDEIYFLPNQRDNLNEMNKLIDEAFEEMISNLNTPSYDDVTKDSAREIEKKVNKLRNKLRDENLSKLGKEDYPVEAAMIYNNLFSSLERIGDHIVNVSESIVGEI